MCISSIKLRISLIEINSQRYLKYVVSISSTSFIIDSKMLKWINPDIKHDLYNCIYLYHKYRPNIIFIMTIIHVMTFS